MRRFALIAALAAGIWAPVSYSAPPPTKAPAAGTASHAPSLTVRQALALGAALRNLDGHLVVVKQNGQDGTVMIPWDFESGSTRLRIANDLSIIGAVEQKAESARQAIVREILKKDGGAELKVGTPGYDDFVKQYDEVLDAPAPGTGDLSKIKASSLKLDKNEIPVTVLAALKPILQMDISP